MSGGTRRTTASASPASRRDPAGYALVIGSYLLFGLGATLVTWADAPASVLLVIRFALAAVVLLVVFARRRPLAGIFKPGVWQRLLVMGALDAFSVIAYYFAVRSVGVAIATFFLFLQPVWVALIAPRLLHAATERVVYVALAIASAGMALILAPSFADDAVSLSVLGLAACLAAGWSYAFFQLFVKQLTCEVSSVKLVIVESVLDAVFLLPLALWQFADGGQALTPRDWFAAVVMGLVTTALAYTMWVDGVARIRVQHSSILGLITPVAAPIYALVFLGQGVAAWTIAGGALILCAAALVVRFGAGEPSVEPSP
jgi:DME family drug/metabolite transporter